MKSIFIEETPIYPKIIKSISKIKVFEGRRVRLGGKFNTKRVQDTKNQVT